MRILTRRIYRAFPELDRYTDEQCERFVRAARRGKLRGAFHGLLILIVGIALFTLGAMAVVYVTGSYRLDRHGLLAAILLFLLIAIPCLGIAPVAGFLTRDWLLRRRVRYILRARGVCMNCRYSLVGLPVNSGAVVTCPECATECHVDPSLGELTTDETGQARYTPSPDAMKPWFFTPKRLRIAKRLGWASAAFALIGVPLLWGAYEVFLANQAARAKASIPGAAALMALVESNQPAGTTPNDPNAFDVLMRAITIMDLTDARVWRGAAAASVAPATYPDFWAIYGDPPNISGITRTPKEQAEDQANLALALKLIEDYRADGLYAKLNEMAGCRRAVEQINIPPGQPLAMYMTGAGTSSRNLARIGGARMQLAWKVRDLPEFSDALRSNLAISRMLYLQPLAISRLIAIAIDALTYGRIRAILAEHPDDAWLDAIAATLAEQASPADSVQMFEGERLYVRDFLGHHFSNPSNTRLGRWSPGVGMLAGSPLSGRLGTFAENAATVDRHFVIAKAIAAADSFARPAGLPAQGSSGLILPDALLPSTAAMLSALDRDMVDRRALPVLIALERYRNQTGEYPATLEALVPNFLKSLPIDPLSGNPFGYRKLNAPDTQGRGFLLYSTGFDKIDNGGQPPPSSPWGGPPLSSWPPTAIGYDYIINEPNK